MPAIGVSVEIVTKPWKDMTHEAERVARRATMFGLRAVGRAVIRDARQIAPVYPGSHNRSAYPDPRAEAEAGNLRKSIRNAKRIKRVGDDYELKVGPFGTKKAGTLPVRYGMEGGMSAIADARSGARQFMVSRMATRNHAFRQGNSTYGQVRGVQLYRSQQESIYEYMRYGVDGVGTYGERLIYEHAYDKAFARFR